MEEAHHALVEPPCLLAFMRSGARKTPWRQGPSWWRRCGHVEQAAFGDDRAHSRHERSSSIAHHSFDGLLGVTVK